METIAVNTATLSSGLRLPYAETGDASGTPVVLVHAYVESWRYFEAVLQRLPASVHCYAPTLRGHGDADRPLGGFRLEDFAADVMEFMDVVGIERAALVGTSSGGLVSQLVAIGRPERVSALILVSSPAVLADKPEVVAMSEEIMGLSDPLDPGFVRDFVRNTSPRSLPDEFAALLVEESLKAPAAVWQESLRGLLDADLPAALEHIAAPTLLICGGQDEFACADQDRLLRGIADSRLITYSGIGHGFHLAYPGPVADDLMSFLAARA